KRGPRPKIATVERRRGERVPLDARRASLGTGPSRAETRDNGILRLSALRPPLMGWMEKEKSKTRAQQRAAGTKKTALFEIVNRNYAATRSVPAEGAPRRVFFCEVPLTPRPAAARAWRPRSCRRRAWPD